MENEITRVESLVANQGLAMAIAILLLVAFIFLLGFAVNEFKKSREESKIVREQERERDEKRHQEYIQINTSNINLIDMNKYGSNVFNLRYINNDDINKLYNYMYENATIYLKRKKDKFDIYFNDRK